jgi:hypothetical protein
MPYIITQQQYDRWIKNMSKNKTGTSWIYLGVRKKKLYQDFSNNLYFEDDIKNRVYLTIEKEEED